MMWIEIKSRLRQLIAEAKKDHDPGSIIAAMIANLAHEAARLAWGKDDCMSAAKVCAHIGAQLMIKDDAPTERGPSNEPEPLH